VKGRAASSPRDVCGGRIWEEESTNPFLIWLLLVRYSSCSVVGREWKVEMPKKRERKQP
jgi:hypothetical protein